MGTGTDLCHLPAQFSRAAVADDFISAGWSGSRESGAGRRGQLRDCATGRYSIVQPGFLARICVSCDLGQSGNAKAIARVLEARILPPYRGQDGLGSNNAPGLSRLESAVFTGEYPLAHIDFQDAALPVTVELDAF